MSGSSSAAGAIDVTGTVGTSTSATRTTTVVVIGGGTGSEHEVSLASAAAIARALDRSRFEVIELTVRSDGSWWHTGVGPLSEDLSDAVKILENADVAIPALHGPGGEDGTVAALLDLVGIPFVGSGVGPGAVAMDKWLTKLVARELGIRVAPGIRVTDPGDPALAAITTPRVVKPNRSGSSHGVAFVPEPSGLRDAVAAALGLDSSVLVEELVHGREIDVAVIERPDGSLHCAPPLEIVVSGGEVFDTAMKYDGHADFRVPAAARGRGAGGAPGCSRRDVPRARLRGAGPGRLLPDPARTRSQRGQHLPGLHRALAGAADVRRRGGLLPRARRTPRRYGCRAQRRTPHPTSLSAWPSPRATSCKATLARRR